MNITRHTVAIQQVQHILQGLHHQGRDPAPLLLRAGIAPSLLASPLARVSQTQYAMLIRLLRRTLRDELWGLCSQPLPLGSFGQCAAMGVHCRDLQQALRLGFRHFHGLMPDFVPRLLIDGDVARVQLVGRLPPGPRQDYAQKAFLLFAWGLASWLVARRVPVQAVDYPGAQQRSDSSRVYQAPIHFGQAHAGLRLEARWLALPVLQSPQSLGDLLAGAPANLLVKYRDSNRLSERIRRLLRRHLATELPSLDAVGQALGIAPQTLRRRLRDEGHGFQALKDDLRRDAAIDYLAQPGLTLITIAYRLGFSEASSFHRAFKKWTGVAPGEYRSTHLAAATAGRPSAGYPSGP